MFLFFLVVSFVLLWPLSGYLASSTTNEGDGLAQIWSIGWDIHALTTDPANLFNGNLFYPYINTIAYTDHLLAQALQAMPVYLLTGNLVLSYNLLTLFSFALSGWATYLLVKEVSGSRAGGLVAGLIFAFASYRVGRLSQLNLLSTQWIPLCLLFLRRMILFDTASKGQSWRRQIGQGWPATLAFAFFFTLNALSSFYYFFYILPVLALYLLCIYAFERRWPSPAFLVRLGAAALLAGLLILPTLLPYAAVVAEQSAERTTREVEQFSANYRFYLGASPNNLLWGKALARFTGTGGERVLFPGGLAYLLALVGLVGPLGLWLWTKIRRRKALSPDATPTSESLSSASTQPRRWERWVWVVIGLFALEMSFGWTLRLKGLEIPGLYRLFYQYVPGWIGLRAALRYSLFVLLAVAVLSGFGVAWLGRLLVRWQDSRSALRFGPRHLSRSSVLGGVLAVLLTAGVLWESRYDISYINPNILPNPPQVYRWLAEPAQAGVVLELPAPADPANPPSIRDYYSTFHWQPQVGGVLGYMPPVQGDLARLINEFPSKEGLAAFQGIGVRWLIFHLDDENTPLPPGGWAKIEARLSKTPQVRLVKEFLPDRIRVYELTPDPWMRQAYAGLPVGADVMVSDYRRLQPTLIELFQTMLRRDGHALFGSDRAGYRFLNPPPAGRPVAAGLFAADENPALYGFEAADEVWSGYDLKFYRRRETLIAAYDLARDPKLASYQEIKSGFELNVEKDGLRFNKDLPGKGSSLSGEGQVSLLLSSFGPQEITIDGQKVSLPGGLSRWRSNRLAVGGTIRLEPAPGQILYLDRAELTNYDSQYGPGLTGLGAATLLKGRTRQDGNRLLSSFEVLAPPVSASTAGSYIVTMDVYRRPWGTHPNGHFGTYSIALPGGTAPHQVEFDFDPTTRKAQARLDGAGVDVGAEVFKAAGDGDWAVFLTVRRSNPANPQDFPLVGLTRAYEFSLLQNRLDSPNLFPERQLVLLPPLK